MGKQDSETPLARRLRELEEEERVLQQHVKEMTRKARRMEHLTSEPGLTRTEPRSAWGSAREVRPLPQPLARRHDLGRRREGQPRVERDGLEHLERDVKRERARVTGHPGAASPPAEHSGVARTATSAKTPVLHRRVAPTRRPPPNLSMGPSSRPAARGATGNCECSQERRPPAVRFHVLELTSGIRASWVKMDAGHGSPTTSARSHRVPLPHRSGRPQPRLNPTPTLENHRERRPDHHPR